MNTTITAGIHIADDNYSPVKSTSTRRTFTQDVTFTTNVVARERKMLMSWCSSAGFGTDSLWGGWLPSLCEMSISEIEAKEPHQPTVMLTIHPHLVNEHPPTLLIPFVIPSPSPPPSVSPLLFFLTLHLLLWLYSLSLSVFLRFSCLHLPLSSLPSISHPLAPAPPIHPLKLITVTWNH